MTLPPDLLIGGGTIVCPATGQCAEGTIAVRDGRFVDVGEWPISGSTRVIDFPDAVILPGLIDLHAHPARSGSIFGVDPDRHLLARGTTTALSQGDAGADNIENYVRETIEPSGTRLRLAINISSAGESGPAGCCERLELLDVPKCVDAIERFHPHIWGIAVNASRNTCGQTDPREVLCRGLQAAEAVGLPILYGMRCPEDWPLAEQLEQLRPNDVVTYCFRRTPHCIVENGSVLPEIREARSRGVRFDVGHGRASFDFDVAETAIGEGFLPDTISTDLQRGHVGTAPVHDLPLVMSKLRAAGMMQHDIFTAVTSIPAEILSVTGEVGSLNAGTCADLTVLRWSDVRLPMNDTSGQTRIGGRWEAVATLRAGHLVNAAQFKP